jgi:hypothetical protein
MTDRSGTGLRTRQIDPERALMIGPTKGRKARESGLRLAACEWRRRLRKDPTFLKPCERASAGPEAEVAISPDAVQCGEGCAVAGVTPTIRLMSQFRERRFDPSEYWRWAERGKNPLCLGQMLYRESALSLDLVKQAKDHLRAAYMMP